VPADCIFSSGFFDDDGCLRREVSIEASEEMARALGREGMTQTSIRNLFNMLNEADRRVKANPDLPLGFVREHYDKFLTQTEYQYGRGIVKKAFRDLALGHKDVAVRSKEEFRGFVDYLRAIIARMQVKKHR